MFCFLIVDSLSEIEHVRERQEDLLEDRDHRIEVLSERLRQKQEHYDNQLTDLNIRLQQDLYITKVLEEKDKKSISKWTHWCKGKGSWADENDLKWESAWFMNATIDARRESFTKWMAEKIVTLYYKNDYIAIWNICLFVCIMARRYLWY